MRVIPGDRRQQRFPTDEAKALLQRFCNRAGSSAVAAERNRQVAAVFFRFYPASGSEIDPEATIQSMALQAGFDATEVFVARADNTRQLLDILAYVGLRDPVSTEDQPANFCEALEHFANEFPEDAIVSARALESAARWEYPDPVIILRDLTVIHRVYGQLLDADGRPIDLRARKRHLEQETGLVLGYEDERTIELYRTDKFPELQGRILRFPLHAKYSFRHTRIHFWFPSPADRDQEVVKTLVAHAGCHLPTGTKGDKR